MSDQQEWIDVEEPSLTTDEVTEVQDAVDQLGELESQVETTDDIATLEAYNYAFGLIQHYNQLGSSNGVSLESYGDHKSKKQHLVTSIRNQKELVHKHLAVALEAYVKNAPSEVAKAVDKYNKAVDELEKVDKEIEAGAAKVAVVDNMRIWNMFHIGGQFEHDGEIALAHETINIEGIIDTLEAAIKEISKTPEEKQSEGFVKKFMQKHFPGTKTRSELMFNRVFSVKDGIITINELPVQPPKRDIDQTAKFLTTFAVTFGSFAIIPFALGGIAMKVGQVTVGRLIGELAGYIFGKDQETTQRDVTKIRSYIKEVLNMDSYIDRLCKIINDLNKDDQLPKEFKVNIISSSNKLINHITEVTHGMSVLLGKLENK